MKTIVAVSIVLACHLLVGCISPHAGCRIAVANATDVPLSSVLVRDEAGTTYAFGGLKPHSVGPYVRTTNDMVGTVTLEIATANAAPVTNGVRLGGAVPRTFDGRVLFQVEANARVRVFIMPAGDKPEGGVLPWATPPSWEGAPNIPGFSARE